VEAGWPKPISLPGIDGTCGYRQLLKRVGTAVVKIQQAFIVLFLLLSYEKDIYEIGDELLLSDSDAGGANPIDNEMRWKVNCECRGDR
jgi:hypothetical protein